MKIIICLSAVLYNTINCIPQPVPQGESLAGGPQARTYAVPVIDWQAKSVDFPNYDNMPHFLDAKPEDGKSCPPPAWLELFWDLTMKKITIEDKKYQKFLRNQQIEHTNIAFKHCKFACGMDLPLWWERYYDFWIGSNPTPITGKHIAERINGRDCVCIDCLQQAGVWSIELIRTSSPFLSLNSPDFLDDWANCSCEPNAEPEAVPEETEQTEEP